MKVTKRQLVAISLLLIGIISILRLAYLNDNHRSYFEYVVQQGDTCLDISYNLGVPVKNIVDANDLMFDCTGIYPGQKLIIPYPTPTPFGFIEVTHVVIDCEKVLYKVEEGDTVVTIANDYFIPKQAIRFFNGLEGDTLTPGTELIIPLCVRTRRYIDPTPIATLTVP